MKGKGKPPPRPPGWLYNKALAASYRAGYRRPSGRALRAGLALGHPPPIKPGPRK